MKINKMGFAMHPLQSLKYIGLLEKLNIFEKSFKMIIKPFIFNFQMNVNNYFCQIEVMVKNGLSNEALTIHWHGMIQKNTPWMDGASMVTQCPINPGDSFLYR